MQKDFSKRMPLELLCLSLLKEQDRYGYEMVREIEERSGLLLSPNVTTLYVVLKRLTEKGYVSVHYYDSSVTRERLRVYYHFEDSANDYYQALFDEYRQTTLGIKNFMKSNQKKRKSAHKL